MRFALVLLSVFALSNAQSLDAGIADLDGALVSDSGIEDTGSKMTSVNGDLLASSVDETPAAPATPEDDDSEGRVHQQKYRGLRDYWQSAGQTTERPPLRKAPRFKVRNSWVKHENAPIRRYWTDEERQLLQELVSGTGSVYPHYSS